MTEFSDRILRGREAAYRLGDETLNAALDDEIELWMRAIVKATPAQTDDVIEAKRQIDAVQNLRRRLKMWLEDGEAAAIEQEAEDQQEDG